MAGRGADTEITRCLMLQKMNYPAELQHLQEPGAQGWIIHYLGRS